MSLTRRYRVDRLTPVRYAGASMDFNPIHLFDDAARAVGLDGAVLHGMCTLTWAVDTIERAAAARVYALRCRFAAPVRVGQTVEIDPKARDDGTWGARVQTEDTADVLRSVEARLHTDAASSPPGVGEALATGREYVYAVGAEKLREFCEAMDIGGAAPLTFLAVVSRRPVFELADDPSIGLGSAGVVHAAQTLSLTRPLCDGDVLRTRAGLLSDRVRRGLRRVVLRSVTRDAAGLHVGVADWTLLRRISQ